MIKELRKRHEDQARIEKYATGSAPSVPKELEKNVKRVESESSDSFASSGEDAGAAFSDEAAEKGA